MSSIISPETALKNKKAALHEQLAKAKDDEEREAIINKLKKDNADDVDVMLLIAAVLEEGMFLTTKRAKENKEAAAKKTNDDSETNAKKAQEENEARIMALIAVINNNESLSEKSNKELLNRTQVNTIVNYQGCRTTLLYKALRRRSVGARFDLGLPIPYIKTLVEAGASFRFGTGLGRPFTETEHHDETCLESLVDTVSLSYSENELSHFDFYSNQLALALESLPDTCSAEGYLKTTFVSPQISKHIMAILEEEHSRGYLLASGDGFSGLPLTQGLLLLIVQYCGELGGRLIQRGFILRQHLLFQQLSGEESRSYHNKLYTLSLSVKIIPHPLETVCKFIESNPTFSNTKIDQDLMNTEIGATAICRFNGPVDYPTTTTYTVVGLMNNAPHPTADALNERRLVVRKQENERHYNYRSRRSAGEDDRTLFRVLPSRFTRDNTVILMHQPESTLINVTRVTIITPKPQGFLYLYEGRELAIGLRRNKPHMSITIDSSNQFIIPSTAEAGAGAGAGAAGDDASTARRLTGNT